MIQKVWITRDKNNFSSHLVFFWKEKPEKYCYYYHFNSVKKDYRFPICYENGKEGITFGIDRVENNPYEAINVCKLERLFGLKVEEGSCGKYELDIEWNLLED